MPNTHTVSTSAAVVPQPMPPEPRDPADTAALVERLRGERQPIPALGTRGRRAPRVPELLAPDPVADAWRRLRTYGRERRTLNKGPNTPGRDRRTSALALLVEDATADLFTAVADNKAAWSDALTKEVKKKHATYSTLLDHLDTARTEVAAAGQVLAWLDSADQRGQFFRQFRPSPTRTLDGRPWPQVIGALRAELVDGPQAHHGDADATLTATRDGVEVMAHSLHNVVARFPDLAFPDALTKPYERHRAALAEHQALSIRRRDLESGRQAAEEADRRALADAIRDGTDDPGDAHAEELDTQVLALDIERAATTNTVQDTHAELVALFRRHRTAWRTAVADLYRDALTRYTDAVAQLPDVRHDYHQARAVLAWLDTTTPEDLGTWSDPGPHRRHQPNFLGQSFDVLHEQFRRDLAEDRRFIDTPSDDAA